ncbi:riboflavin synthase [Natranaerobius trueperi]|uniref:Riboflavin synthase n=1 Tax=Natranaerobius trueperi TaxID=759412 RepID=A0A226C030_9FIRM|nr:riboflavin synthase [Natranaerobius trueperi]OWZ84545.1 riboflavin synthase [Natranaerobius trueperi]
MFTGIVEEVGKIKSVSQEKDSIKLTISANIILDDVKLGDSISTNGVCLTVTRVGKDFFVADVMPETIRRSNLRYAKPNTPVNLERAMRLADRLGGHIVSGHVDGLAKIVGRKMEGNAEVFSFQIVEQVESNIDKYIIEKGSIAVDGISLTVVNCSGSDFSVSIIPHSKENTVLAVKDKGDYVNVETDIIGKYVEKMLIGKDDNKEPNNDEVSTRVSPQLDMSRLRELGY